LPWLVSPLEYYRKLFIVQACTLAGQVRRMSCGANECRKERQLKPRKNTIISPK
jgi:hypothetical protein